MTDQKQHYDKYLLREQQLREWLGINRPQLLKSLDENKSFYLFFRLVYAAEDSISFLFGNEKLAFSLIATYHQQSDSGASHEMHDFMQTLDGIIVTGVIGGLLIFVQMLGAYLLDAEDLKENSYKYFFAKVLAPYLRDILQGVKWAYKGMRAVLNTLVYFMVIHQEVLLKILFPLSIAIAVVSLLNRIFLRTMRNIRKDKQSDNRKRSIEAYEMSYDLKFRRKLPKDDDKKGLAKLKNSLVYVMNGPEKSAESDKEDSSDQGGTSAEQTVKAASSREFAEKLFYIDADGNKTPIALSEELDNDLNQKIQEYQTENIRKRLEQRVDKMSEFADANRGLFFISANDISFDNAVNKLVESEELRGKYSNKLLYRTDSNLDVDKRLYYINPEGRLVLHSQAAMFARLVQCEIYDKSALNLLSSQTDELVSFLSENISLGDYQLGPRAAGSAHPIVKFKQENEGVNGEESKIVKQPQWLIICSFIAVVLSALIDSSYFYIGVLFLARLNPSAFISMLVMASIMVTVCLVARIFEEYNYQKVFRVSQIEVRLNTEKTNCRRLLQEYELADDIETKEQILTELKVSLDTYYKEQKDLEKNISMTTFEAFFRGLRNGLSTQGVVSSLMFLGATIMFLVGTPCPASFLISMMAVSFAMMVYSVGRYMLSHREYEKTKPQYSEINVEQTLQELGADADIDIKFAKLKEIKNDLDLRVMTRAPDTFDEEYCEAVGRLPLSAFCKAEKNYTEFTFGEPRDHESWWMTLLSLTFAVSMGVAFFFRGIYKMFTVPDENPNIVEHTGLVSKQGFFEDKRPSSPIKGFNNNKPSQEGIDTTLNTSADSGNSIDPLMDSYLPSASQSN